MRNEVILILVVVMLMFTLVSPVGASQNLHDKQNREAAAVKAPADSGYANPESAQSAGKSDPKDDQGQEAQGKGDKENKNIQQEKKK